MAFGYFCTSAETVILCCSLWTHCQKCCAQTGASWKVPGPVQSSHRSVPEQNQELGQFELYTTHLHEHLLFEVKKIISTMNSTLHQCGKLWHSKFSNFQIWCNASQLNKVNCRRGNIQTISQFPTVIKMSTSCNTNIYDPHHFLVNHQLTTLNTVFYP